MEFKYIVGQMQEDLITRAQDLVSLVIENKYDTLVFLDRSARPASWIFEAFYKDKPLPAFVFICTGKKKNLIADSSTLKQIEQEFKPQEESLKGKKVLIVDDIERDGTQRKFVEEVLRELYEPSQIDYFEWNKLGGMRLPHGLSYEDKGTFHSRIDESKKEAVEQVKKEIMQLAQTSV